MAEDESPPQHESPPEPSPALRRAFWMLVIVFDIALLGVGLGGLLLWFGVREPLGWTVLIVGITAFGFGYGWYRRRAPD